MKKGIISLILIILITVPVFGDNISAIVSAVQQELNNLGYDCGAADGILGANTSQAITEFQRTRNIQADGMISNDLLAELWLAEHVQQGDNSQVSDDALDIFSFRASSV